jgi:hypothetical protein
MRSTWGAAWGVDPEPESTTTPWDQYLTVGTQAISAGLESYQDPYRRLELAKARLSNARARGATPSRIRVLQAKVSAASAAVGVEAAEETSDREYRLLGKLSIITGIAAGGALIVLLLSGAKRVQR